MKISCKEPYARCGFRDLSPGDVFRENVSDHVLLMKTITVSGDMMMMNGCTKWSKPAYNSVYLTTGYPEYIPDVRCVYRVEGSFTEDGADV